MTRKLYARNEVLTINIQQRTFYYELGNNEINEIQFGQFFVPNHKMKTLTISMFLIKIERQKIIISSRYEILYIDFLSTQSIT